jgi:hypothetical protein
MSVKEMFNDNNVITSITSFLYQLHTVTSMPITCQAIARTTRADVARLSVCTCLSTAIRILFTFIDI